MLPHQYAEISQMIGTLTISKSGRIDVAQGSWLKKYEGVFYKQIAPLKDGCIKSSAELLEELSLASSDSLVSSTFFDDTDVLLRCDKLQEAFRITVLRVEQTPPRDEESSHTLREALTHYGENQDDFFLMLIDIEDVFELNASIGYDAASRRLRRMEKMINKHVNELPNGLLLTLTGGHYAILGTSCCANELEQISQEILADLHKKFGSEGLFNCGCSFLSQSKKDIDTLLLSVQHNLKVAKRSQSRGIVLTENGKQPFERNKRLDLERAIADKEFTLFYQPIICMRSGDVMAVEALSRWNHPSRGMLPPSEFIDHLQKYKLMELFSELLIDTACSDQKEWFGDVKVSINFSPSQLENKNFTENLVSRIRSHKVCPSNIQVEITEDTTHSAKVINAVRQLTNEGVAVALDDFGSGYCNVMGISSVMATTVKLDRSLIAVDSLGQRQPGFIKSVVAMCKSLSKFVVIEGIETPSQEALVIECGADMGQGYLYSKPMPPELLSSEVKRRKAKRALDAKC